MEAPVLIGRDIRQINPRAVDDLPGRADWGLWRRDRTAGEAAGQ